MGLLGNFIKSNVDVDLEFADGVGPYVVGDKVRGRAVLSTEKADVRVRKIVLTVSGEQKLTVNFIEEYSNSEDGEDVWNTAENISTFFEKSITIEESDKILPIGKTEYDFEFDLPLDGKTSFNPNTNTEIKYICKVSVDIPMGVDGEGSGEIFVSAVKDLNDYKETLEVAEAQDEETLGCCCFAQGPISINVNMAKSGFVPGEKAVINVKVCNKTRKLIKRATLELVNVSTCFADLNHLIGGKERKVESQVNTVMDPLELGSVEAGGEKMFVTVLTIPELAISFEDPDCTNTYSLTVKTEPDTLVRLRDHGANIPIIIGNIPHRISFKTFSEGGRKLPDHMTKVYPSLPGYSGLRYVSYTTQ